MIVKNFKILATVLVLLSSIHFISGCKNDDDHPTPEQQRISDLSSTWILGSVENDDNDVTNQFNGFSLVVDQTSFTTQNGGNAWPANGSFTYVLVENDIKILERNDGVEISVDKLSNDELRLSFQITTLPGGRQEGITGQFIFSLIKQ